MESRSKMIGPALKNLVATSASYISPDTFFSLLEEGLVSLSVAVLREFVAVLEIPNVLLTTKKGMLITLIQERVESLNTEPLTFEGLKREADKKDISHFDLSYRDLRVLLGYETIGSAGKLYYIPSSKTPLHTILSTTDPGSYNRLTQLKRYAVSPSHDQSMTPRWPFDDQPHVSIVYKYLYMVAIPLTDQPEAVYYSLLGEEDGTEDYDISQILKLNGPGSEDRIKLLRGYDPLLVRAFQLRCGMPLGTVEQLHNVILLSARNEAEEDYHQTHRYRYTYENTEDDLLRVLHLTAENTVQRYIALADSAYTIDMDRFEIESFVGVPQLRDERPHKIRDYTPSEFGELDKCLLLSLMSKEGIVVDYGSLYVEQLQVAYVSPAFVCVAAARNTTQTHTCLLTELTAVPLGQLYAYGTRDGSDKLIYYERDELSMKFASENNFIDPYGEKEFKITAIRRLSVLSLNDESVEGKSFTSLLTSLLALVEDIKEQEQAFVLLCGKKGVGADRAQVVEVINLLFEAGFYMRRWGGPGTAYPLRVASTLAVGEVDGDGDENNDHAAVESLEEMGLFSRVNTALERFRVGVEGLPVHLKDRFWNLGLKNYKASGYYSPSDEDDGVTVKDRFEIVCQGNSASAPINSCLRLTSGWFVFTALYYHRLLVGENLGGVRAHEVEFVS